MAEALAYAHAQGVLHRDVKPSNLLLDSAGTVWVTDFGLAKDVALPGAQPGADLTHTGEIVGTVRFMAPERLAGRSDARSDVRVRLARDSVYLGFDVVCLGRTASDERFSHGAWRQCIDIERDHALIWSERVALRGGDALLRAKPGLNGSPVFGTFAAMAANIPDDLILACRKPAPARAPRVITLP